MTLNTIIYTFGWDRVSIWLPCPDRTPMRVSWQFVRQLRPWSCWKSAYHRSMILIQEIFHLLPRDLLTWSAPCSFIGCFRPLCSIRSLWLDTKCCCWSRPLWSECLVVCFLLHLHTELRRLLLSTFLRYIIFLIIFTMFLFYWFFSIWAIIILLQNWYLELTILLTWAFVWFWSFLRPLPRRLCFLVSSSF